VNFALARAVLVRCLAMLSTLAGATALSLLLLVLAPGDPIDLIPGGEALRPQLEAQWGLDRAPAQRYWHYARRVAVLDLGSSVSYRPGQPVFGLLAGPATRTAARVLAALACAVVWGTALAWWTAGRRSFLRTAALAVSIAPVFLLAHGFVMAANEGAFAAMQSGWLERPSWFALPDEPSPLRTTLSIVLLAVGSSALHETHAQAEEALLRIRSSVYVDAARARGAPVWPHIARNLIAPLAATTAERAAFLTGGVVIVEKVLLLNGAGAMLWEAARLRDYDLALGIALLAALLVGTVRLAADATRALADPRLRGRA